MPDSPVLLYDGLCGFCDGTVQFILRHDRKKTLRFATLQGDYARGVIDRHPEFVTAMEHVVGPQEAVEAICIGPDDDMEARRKDIADAIAKVEQGQGVIILTDLFGGTPSNLAISLMKSENVEVIAGVNLPMLIRLEGARKVMPVHAAVAAAREAGRKYISVASEILGEAAA